MATAKKSQSTEVATNDESEKRHELSVSERFSNDQLREIKSLDDAMAALVGAYGDVLDIEEFELGTGFNLMSDSEKERLIGVPFIVLHFQFNEGDFGEFASMTLMTMDKNQSRLVLNDGSTGICDQLRDIARSGRFGGFTVKRGLRKSEYDTCLSCGKPRKPSETTCGTCQDDSEKRGRGTTYYLAV